MKSALIVILVLTSFQTVLAKPVGGGVEVAPCVHGDLEVAEDIVFQDTGYAGACVRFNFLVTPDNNEDEVMANNQKMLEFNSLEAIMVSPKVSPQIKSEVMHYYAPALANFKIDLERMQLDGLSLDKKDNELEKLIAQYQKRESSITIRLKKEPKAAKQVQSKK